MNDRDRLIELVNQVRGDEIALADYEADVLVDHLLANGVIVPPCNVGDGVYYVHETFYDKEYMQAKEDELDFSNIVKIVERPNCKTNLMLEKTKFDWLLMGSWLKGEVFLTKEEAEEKLNEMNKGE